MMKASEIKITINTNEPLTFTAKDLAQTQQQNNERLREYCARALDAASAVLQISAAISLPEIPPIDPRVIELSQRSGYSAQTIADLFKEAYRLTGATLDQCIAFVTDDPARLRGLAYCLEVTKHWNATNLAQLRAQGFVLDP